MGNQYRNSNDDAFDQELENQEEERQEERREDERLDVVSDAFKSHQVVRDVYYELCREYKQIDRRYANILKADSQFPPYWDEEKNQEEVLPNYNHNVSSGRFVHTKTQLSLTYNSFFPTQSYNKGLLDLKIVEDPRKDQDLATIEGSAASNPGFDKEKLIEKAFDNLIKDSSWAKQAHLKMVSDKINYGCGIYYYPKKGDYKYEAIDFNKCKFPCGTKLDVDEWEYVFIEGDVSFNFLINKFNSAKEGGEGYDKKGLEGILLSLINRSVTGATSHGSSGTGEKTKVEQITDLKIGLSQCNIAKACPATIPVVSCFWKNTSGSIGSSMFVSPHMAFSNDGFIYYKENDRDNFSDLFSIFPADETQNEIREVRGWGSRIYSLCHSYDRVFCKFLDGIEQAATVFIDADPNDLIRKIYNFGNYNVGQVGAIQKLPDNLNSMISALAYLDAKIDQITFTKGLNKTELQGNGRGNELAQTLLTVEGRVHKHLMTRFIERYTIHFRKTLKKILQISLKDGKSKRYPEVDSKFKKYLQDRNVTKKDLMLDDTSEINDGLPSNWCVVARKPDGSGISPALPHVVQMLSPYMSSIPESGLQALMSMIFCDATGDPDLVQQILGDTSGGTENSAMDLLMAQMQVCILTAQHSDFDHELSVEGALDSQLLHTSKFRPFPAIKGQDHIVFITVLLGAVGDALQRFDTREIGRPTLHIWMYNLISTAQNHVEKLRSDAIRGSRPEAQALFQQFGQLFNELRRVESQANADRAKRLDALGQQIAAQDAEDPKVIEANAKMLVARARVAEVQGKINSDNLRIQLDQAKDNREERDQFFDMRDKNLDAQQKTLDIRQQSLVGRPSGDEQRGGN